jgi:hypothetical protein
VDAVLARDTDLITRQALQEAALVAGPVPAPRPEVLSRVLEGLRDLPAVRPAGRETDTGGTGDTVMPLPRRRS